MNDRWYRALSNSSNSVVEGSQLPLMRCAIMLASSVHSFCQCIHHHFLRYANAETSGDQFIKNKTFIPSIFIQLVVMNFFFSSSPAFSIITSVVQYNNAAASSPCTAEVFSGSNKAIVSARSPTVEYYSLNNQPGMEAQFHTPFRQ